MTTKSRDKAAERTVTVEDLFEDLRAVVRDAEALLRETEGHVGERISEIRARAEESLGSARERLQDAREGVGIHARSAARSTDEYVRENPWTAVAVAAGIGLLVGLLARRR